jgi:hypothetical protein
MVHAQSVITSSQMRAARAMLGIDQCALAALSDLSVPTVQRTEASNDVVPGNVDLPVKLVDAKQGVGIELTAEVAARSQGRHPACIAHSAPPRRTRHRRA